MTDSLLDNLRLCFSSSSPAKRRRADAKRRRVFQSSKIR